MIYYHLTDEENLKSIIKDGLKPLIGKNSKLGGEKEPAIYLCKRKDLPYWKILLNKNILICIRLTKDQEKNLLSFNYSNYGEFLCKEMIPKEQINLSKCKIEKKKAMKDLCISHIYSIGNMCSDIVEYYSASSKDKNEYLCLKRALQCMLQSLSRLDYTSLNKSEIINAIKDSSNEDYAFTDKCGKENIRMYEKISMYEDDVLSGYAHQLTEYIKHTFADFLQ